MMKRCFAAVLMLAMLASAALAESPAWMPRQIDAPETQLQQALYGLALEQQRILLQNIGLCWENTILPEHEYGALSNELLEILSERETLLARPKSVLLMLPSASFGDELVENLPESMWSSLGMNLSYRANNAMLERDQAEVLERFSLYDAQLLPPGKGVAHLVCTYGAGLPQIVTAVQLSEDGLSACKTNLVFHKHMEDVSAYIGMAITVWGENAFECVYLRTDV